MKTKILILICLLSIGFAFSNEQQEEVAHIDGPSKETTTLVVTDYLDNMRTKCNFGVAEFEEIGEALSTNTPHLINPIPKEQAELSSQCFAYWTGWNKLIEITKHHSFDQKRVLAKTKEIINEIEENEYERERAEKKTENINIAMAFVTIPQQNYDNEWIGEFVITNNIEIQETPVTQYQWAKIMGKNLAYFKTGEDARKVDINGQEIEMCPNKPVESVSYNDIMTFISRLNEQDEVYEYSLPSLEEYLAITSLGVQRATSSCLNQEATCHVEFSDYITIGKKRLYALSSNVREFTRDTLQGYLPDTNHLLFGSFYGATNDKVDTLTALTRPLYYPETSSPDTGFRLVRYKKSSKPEPSQQYPIQWSKEEIDNDDLYLWDKDAQLPVHGIDGRQWELENKCRIGYFGWMLDHKELYHKNTQHTINVLLKIAQKDAPGQLPSVYLINLTELDIYSYNQIIDVGPLALLTNLTRLNLGINQISNIFALSSLTNLTNLDLHGNQIHDISPLKQLTNLKKLKLNDNQIRNISALASLVNLVKLRLGNNQISDISPLAELSNLTKLRLSDNLISNISPLSLLTNLTKLYLWNNQVQDILPLSLLTNLVKLSLMGNQIRNISPLSMLTDLIYLDGRDNPISDWNKLDELKKNGCAIYN